MEIGSKMIIYKCSLVEPKNGDSFYNTVLLEKVYNAKRPSANKWENCFYNAYIFDKSMDIEAAVFKEQDEKGRDKYAINLVENPEKSIIRVMEFKFEKHTDWYGQNQKKDDYGNPIMKDCFYITKITDCKTVWRSDEYKLREALKLIEEMKTVYIRRDYHENIKQKYYESKIIISDLKNQIKQLTSKIEKLTGKNEESKELVKQANRNAMVFKRMNTINENKFNDMKEKLEEQKQIVKDVKKMKKEEIINKADTFDNVDFGLI